MFAKNQIVDQQGKEGKPSLANSIRRVAKDILRGGSAKEEASEELACDSIGKAVLGMGCAELLLEVSKTVTENYLNKVRQSKESILALEELELNMNNASNLQQSRVRGPLVGSTQSIEKDSREEELASPKEEIPKYELDLREALALRASNRPAKMSTSVEEFARNLKRS